MKRPHLCIVKPILVSSRPNMSDPDREERKREYNRLAQREFPPTLGRRRKEHLKNLEQLQKEQKSEQSDEIERLRAQNAELRKENEALRCQIYGSYQLLPTAPSVHSSRSHSPARRPFSESPPQLIGTLMTMAPSLSVSVAATTPGSLIPQHQQDPYHLNPHGGSSRASPSLSGLDQSLRSMTMSQSIEHQAALGMPGYDHQLVVVVPCDRTKLQSYIRDLFKPLLNPAVNSSPEIHLGMLKSLERSLPRALKPTTAQLETPHYYGIDMIPFPVLRDRLISLGVEASRGFVQELGQCGEDDGVDDGFSQVTVWGDDLLNEMAWEVSQLVLERWGWLLGPEFIQRANFWRRLRGAPVLPEW
ncbi:hypothetical protein FGG08_006706 [Glutinoglossum americanum]|uniref:BZIP domain-containing protein n=1 Tax=Glutinoglossum americanum TaxID=1670608 RepID=A0A9P8I0P9_9PEZI|nr:hypothetical protein FGG08_006706 [Glutinoglossum americanum]